MRTILSKSRTRDTRVILLLCVFFLPIPVSAASFFVHEEQSISGQTVLSLYTDTSQKAPINAASGILSLPFPVASVDVSDSIFTLWQTEPTITEDGNVSFSGGTFARGGFIFPGKLFSVALPQSVQVANLRMLNGHITAHDGEGTDLFYEPSFELEKRSPIPASFDTNHNGHVSLRELSIGLTRNQ